MVKCFYLFLINGSYYQSDQQQFTKIQYDHRIWHSKIIYPSIELVKYFISFQEEDFFPNSDHPHKYWSGFFISRPSFKGYVKRIGRYFQQVNILYPLVKMNNFSCDETIIQDLSKALAQHHDAITGAAKQYVINDYLNMIHKAYIKMENQINTFLNYLSNTSSIFHAQCQFNESDKCDSLFDPLCQNQTVIVTIIDTKINIDGQQEYMKMLIPIDLNIKVEDEQGNLIRGDIICINHKCILYIPRQINNFKLLHYIKIMVDFENNSEIIRLDPKFIEIKKDTKIFDKFQLNYKVYLSNSSRLSSGAYIFRPNGNATDYGDYLSAIQFSGQIIQQIYFEKTTLNSGFQDLIIKIYFILILFQIHQIYLINKEEKQQII